MRLRVFKRREGRGLAYASLKYLNIRFRKDQLKTLPVTLGPREAGTSLVSPPMDTSNVKSGKVNGKELLLATNITS